MTPIESFRDLLLRYRGRSRLTQRDLADRLHIHRRSVQEWENGASYPSAERLEALIPVLLEADGLRSGYEADEAQALWGAVQREAPRTHAPFDQAWFARLLAERGAPTPAVDTARVSRPAEAVGSGPASPVERRQDWGEAPDTTSFVGRTTELQTLRSWVLDDRCRLLAILGMGGIGKTSLAARVAQDLAPSFQRVYWRSLRDAPAPCEWLAGAIRFLSDEQVVPPGAEAERLSVFATLLRERRCLLVLDNFESLLAPGNHCDAYQSGRAAFGRLLEVVGAAAHRSCLILTSREAPSELAVSGDGVRILRLDGLGTDDARALLATRRLQGTDAEWAEFVAQFGGNGLALKVASASIRDLFGGDLASFLEEARGGSIFGATRRLVAEQFDRSSPVEQQVLRFMAVAREPVRLADLLTGLGDQLGRGAVLEGLSGLRRRSLLERAELPGAAAFTLPSLVREYLTGLGPNDGPRHPNQTADRAAD